MGQPQLLSRTIIQATSPWIVVSPGYFETFNIPVVRGRTFTDRDDSGPRTVVINEAFASRVWPLCGSEYSALHAARI